MGLKFGQNIKFRFFFKVSAAFWSREWAEVVHSGQDRRTSPMGYGFHGWDSPDHRERNRGYLEQLGYRCW